MAMTMYEGATTQVKVDGGLSVELSLNAGVHQRSISRLCLVTLGKDSHGRVVCR